MIPKELFKRIRQIEITTSRLVTDVFAGQYHSVFKGQGIEFDEVREYQIGDDIRTIDWNVTARTGEPYVKKFIEERELSVMILVDVSASNVFGSVHYLKSQLAAEVSALLALSAIRNHDKVGLIIFTDRIEKFIPPRKGRAHVLRVIREILYFKPEGRQTDIIQALEYLNRVATRKNICFLLSDFFTPHPPEILKKKLSITHKRHDLIGVSLNDPRESVLPNAGLLGLYDSESGKKFMVDSSDAEVRKQYELRNQLRQKNRKQLFRSAGMDFIELSTDQSYADALVTFFKDRQKKR